MYEELWHVRMQIWSGSLTGLASKALPVTADYLAGPADIAPLLGHAEVITAFHRSAMLSSRGVTSNAESLNY